MAKSWNEVSVSPVYQALPPAEQEAAKRQYFDTNVGPKVPAAERGAAWEQFRGWQSPAVAIDRQPDEPSDQSLGSGLAREAVQGATFEFGDEIGLGVAALAAKIAGKLGLAPDDKRIGEIYRDMREHYDAERGQFRDEHPVAATAANIAGSLGTGGLGGAKLVAKATGPVTRALTMAGAGAAEGALTGSGAADPGGKLEGAVRGAAVGAVAAPVLGATTGAAQRALGKRAAVNEVKRLAPERDDLRDAAQALYRQADNLGVVLKPQTVSSIQGQLAAAAQDLGFHPGIHPKVAMALEDFADLAKPGTTPTLARLEQQRRILGAAAKSLEPDERRIASELIDHYDDAIQGLKASDVHAGNYVQAGATLKQARGLWQKQAKLGVIDDAIEKAKNQASGFENGLRTQFRQLLNNPKRMRGFSTEEREAMKQLVRGGPVQNTLKLLGRFGWGERGATNVVGAAIGASAGAVSAGGVGALAIPVIGQMARRGAQQATLKQAEGLYRLAALGAHPRAIVNRYADIAGRQATPDELAKFLVAKPEQDLLELSAKLNELKGPNRKMAMDALTLALTGQAAAAASEE